MDKSSDSMTMAKLSLAAKLYDRKNPNSLPMDEFDVGFMSINEFNNSLKKIFNMKLTADELSFLSKKFDNGSGQIDCALFKKVFHKEGKREREKEQQALKEKQRQHEEKRKKEKELKEKALSVTTSQLLTFTEDDLKSAMDKLTDAAWNFSKGHNVSLGGFDTKTIPPDVFKEQLRQVFKVIVTPPELSALMAHYDKTGTGVLNCSDFLIQVFRLGYEERCRRTENWRKIDNDKIDRIKNEQKKLEKKLEEQQAVKLVSFTEEDSQRALAKLTEAATNYDRNSTKAISLSEFDREYMPPHMFKEQLRRVLNIQFSPPELSALVAHFDKEQTGRIVCQEFLMQFYHIGNEERTRLNSKRLESQRRKEVRDREKWEKRREESMHRAAALVDFNFTEDDFDSALKKFIYLFYQIDRRHFGADDMKAFAIDAMQPSEFRELMKRNLNFKVLPAELGALIALFDSKNAHVVSCNLFTQIFTTTRVRVEEFKGKANEKQLLEDYQKSVKEAYKARLQRLEEGDEDAHKKPWRSTGSTKRIVQGKIVRQRRPYPTSALQKLKRRLAVAKATTRLDLSARTKWGGMYGSTLASSGERERSSSEVAGNDPDAAVAPELTNAGDLVESTFVTASALVASTPLESHIKVASVPPRVTKINPHHAGASPTNPVCTEINIYLISLPTQIFHMQGLTELWLCNNELTTIPIQIASLKNLEILSLKNNKIDVLPEELCVLTNLQKLYIQGNQLASLPLNLGRLQGLADLDISRNRFTSLPETVPNLASLQLLNVSHNAIALLPTTFLKLKSLMCLHMEGTAVNGPPPVLEKMYWVYVVGCPLPTTSLAAAPLDILVQDLREMESFVRHKAKARNVKKKVQG